MKIGFYFYILPSTFIILSFSFIYRIGICLLCSLSAPSETTCRFGDLTCKIPCSPSEPSCGTTYCLSNLPCEIIYTFLDISYKTAYSLLDVFSNIFKIR